MNAKRMRRPPTFRKPTLIRLDQGAVERIDRVRCGKETRADFIRRAIDRELTRRERARPRVGAWALALQGHSVVVGTERDNDQIRNTE